MEKGGGIQLEFLETHKEVFRNALQEASVDFFPQKMYTKIYNI